jgi:hypothetical protein
VCTECIAGASVYCVADADSGSQLGGEQGAQNCQPDGTWGACVPCYDPSNGLFNDASACTVGAACQYIEGNWRGDCTTTCKPNPQLPPSCDPGQAGYQQANVEPWILSGYVPVSGQPISATGQIKIWVQDEGAPLIAPGEQVDPDSGAIVTPGMRPTYEPALYMAPGTKEDGGAPHYPTTIKGQIDNGVWDGGWPNGPPIDPDPYPPGYESYATAEYVWDVSSLGVGPGTYLIEFEITDGDGNPGAGCFTLVIQ